ncbi:MAG TPA: MlaD family protein [Myxococcales bacterium]|jgi:phospholipid/cholesterol/gamma-HCH transport system substrate-binding protein|nr:MlaD family protein [Myxococcales bacterium]
MSSTTGQERRLIIRVGLFVALGLGLAAVVILAIGKERRLFEKHYTYHAAFENVDGLNLDSPVRLGGLDCGRVTSITFSPDLGDKRIQVQMEISTRFAERIRKDSIARVTNRGVLGDKAVDVSLGSPDSPEIPNGGELQTGSSGELSALIKSSAEILDNAVQITRDLKGGISSYTQPEMRNDVAAAVKAARAILEEVTHGEGALHAAIFDKKAGSDVKAVLASLATSATKVEHAASDAEQILREIREGNGPAHALVYDKKAAQALSSLGTAATELAELVNDARTSPNGAVHQLVYGDAKGLFADLGATAADLRKITARVKAGDGSLGAIINDPTLYEDLKVLLGNVKRNQVLKELVRFSIQNASQEGGKPPRVGDPEKPPPPPESKDKPPEARKSP